LKPTATVGRSVTRRRNDKISCWRHIVKKKVKVCLFLRRGGAIAFPDGFGKP
jgi:hypothetical protein